MDLNTIVSVAIQQIDRVYNTMFKRVPPRKVLLEVFMEEIWDNSTFWKRRIPEHTASTPQTLVNHCILQSSVSNNKVIYP